MNKSVKLLVALVALSISGAVAQAQTAAKVLVVDMIKLLDEHYKTQEQKQKLEADAQKAKEEADRLYRAGERKAQEVAQYAGDYYDEMSDMVRRKPAQALGIAAGVGFLVGLILARR